jgi:hypothetical protein
VLGAKQAPDLGSIAKLRALGVTHLALCEKNYAAFAAEGFAVKDEANVAARRAFYLTALERGRIVRSWSAGSVDVLQPGLVLLDITAIDAERR